jgi:DNA-binding transcriptional LysR family regulator
MVRFRFLTQVEEPYLAIERGDASMSVAPSTMMSSNHPNEELLTDAFYCIAWSEGRYGASPLTQEQFLEAGHVVMEPNAMQQSFDSIMFEKIGVARNAEVTTFNFASLPHLIVGADRLATVHGHLARKFAAAAPITLHPLPFETDPFRQNIQWHQHKTTDPAVVWLRELMHAAVRRLEAEAPGVERMTLAAQ